MKFIWLSVLCILSEVCFAQMKIETLSFDTELAEAFRKAKKEKKLVFMDSHTRWCDGCRRMEKEVFTDTSVVRFFQSNFINVSVDMSEGEGRTLAGKYNLRAFPALLFLDAKGKVVHRVIGYCPSEEFIAEGKRAMDTKRCLKGMTKRFERGDRSPEFLSDYVTVLRKANSPDCKGVVKLYVGATGLKKRFEAGERGFPFMDEYADVLEIAKDDEDLRVFVPEYLSALPVERMAERRNWQWLRCYCILRFTTAMRKVADHPEVFVRIAGGVGPLNQLIDRTLRQEMFYYLRWLHDPKFSWNKQAFESFMSYLKRFDTPIASECYIQLTALKCVVQKDYEGLFENMRQVLQYNVLPVSSGNAYFRNFLTALKDCQDVKWVKEGICLIDEDILIRISEEQKREWEKLRQQLVRHTEELGSE
ncbi:thioredoxin family protein [Gabonibacter chumensis]|uniref:thioredoxin family protein n=1 Tax=Gabonibacter chumensis TaxID=2972474 RepID=UPI00257375AF|nr:thioredoxin family protein [Gabonibacter chumensis]MCR9011876.1 thioredoxin family protein [Gabonibacter chumensis]